MTEESAMRRKFLDHERYMREREARKRKQREYYKVNREDCKAKVRECMKKRRRREYEKLNGSK